MSCRGSARPVLAMADIVCAAGQGVLERNRQQLRGVHFRMLCTILLCRTAALGGHPERYTDCNRGRLS